MGEMEIDCLREVSAMGPKINPKTSGAAGQFLFERNQPIRPKMMQTHTSNILFRME